MRELFVYILNPVISGKREGSVLLESMSENASAPARVHDMMPLVHHPYESTPHTTGP